MASQNHQKKVYVVYRGRVDKPTIYSSWGYAHPKVTNFVGADHLDFDRLEDARFSMKQRGIEEYEEVLKYRGVVVRRQPRGKYYSVAYGRKIGVFKDWKTAEDSTKGFSSACHQRFDTEYEATGFIEDWNASFAEIWSWAIKKGLCDGWKARGLNLDISSVLAQPDEQDGQEVDPDKTLLSSLKRLSVKNEIQD